MSLTQILAWLIGPGAGMIISWILEQWTTWKDWKPADVGGFDPKAVISGVGSALIGLVAYAAATNIPATTISTLDPYVSAAFPLLTLLAVQVWHALVNKRLSGVPATISVPVVPGSANVTIAPQPATPATTVPDKPASGG